MCRLYLRSRRTSNLAGCSTTPAFETEKRGVMPRGSTGCGTGLAGQNYIEDGCPASPFFAANGLTKPDTFVTNRQTRLAHCVSRLLLQAAATVLRSTALIHTPAQADIIHAHRRRSIRGVEDRTQGVQHGQGRQEIRTWKNLARQLWEFPASPVPQAGGSGQTEKAEISPQPGGTAR